MLAVFFPLSAAMVSKAQDVVAVDPTIAKVEFENEQIRVLRLTYAPHQKSHMHSQPPRFLVTLTKNNIRSTMLDGTSSMSQRDANVFAWSEPVTHAEENLADEPMDNIEIELKTAKGPGVAAKLDTGEKKGAGTEKDPVPVEQEPTHRLVFANQYVRILEVIVPPGRATLFHTHSLDYVSIMVSDTSFKNQVPGEDWTKRPAARGFLGFRKCTETPFMHRVMNTGTVPFHVFDVEIVQ